MSELILLKPTESDITGWISHFVPDLELWWWDDSPIPNENKPLRVIARAVGRNDPIIGDITYVNAFHTWAMHENVERIIVDDGSWIDSLSADERQRASELQVRFNRGLCIPERRFGDSVVIPESAVFDGMVVLDRSLWESLPDHAKRSVVESEPSDWDRDTTYQVPVGTPAHITEIANSFVSQHGVNCLSVTAYALTADRNDLHQWMMPGTFNAVLKNTGYQPNDASTPEAGDVIAFVDDDGEIAHAAYAIGPNRILNKSGQTSFNPIAILNLPDLVDDWTSYHLVVYRS